MRHEWIVWKASFQGREFVRNCMKRAKPMYYDIRRYRDGREGARNERGVCESGESAKSLALVRLMTVDDVSASVYFALVELVRTSNLVKQRMFPWPKVSCFW